jgi:hypothetical protein
MNTYNHCWDTTNTCTPSGGGPLTGTVTSGTSFDSDVYLRIGNLTTDTDGSPNVTLATEDSSVIKVCHFHFDGNNVCSVVSCDN